MTNSDGFFGFGQGATGAKSGTVATEVRDIAGLRAALRDAATASSTLITIAAGEYDFATKSNQVLDVLGRKITIQPMAGARVVLRNVQLYLHVESIDKILIQDLAFRSDGAADNARDAIRIAPKDGLRSASTQSNLARVRISHCSFDGYYDIAIDSRSATAFPRILATIDHCLFFDSMPGQPETLIDGFPAFVNRGAINFGSLAGPGGDGQPQLASNSSVTVAYNVFVNVWRRCPRIANGNFGHIFNNLVFRWGFGNTEDTVTNKTNAWLGIGVGHGDGVVDNGNNGSALIEANRFLPWGKKKNLDKTIDIGPNTTVDIGTSSNLPNRFDDQDAVQRDVVFPAPPGGFATIGTTPFDDVGLTKPPVAATTAVVWADLIAQSGPREGREPSSDEPLYRQIATNALTPVTKVPVATPPEAPPSRQSE